MTQRLKIFLVLNFEISINFQPLLKDPSLCAYPTLEYDTKYLVHTPPQKFLDLMYDHTAAQPMYTILSLSKQNVTLESRNALRKKVSSESIYSLSQSCCFQVDYGNVVYGI